MPEVLSQQQIDQLLSTISASTTEKEDTTGVGRQHRIKIYDFKRPDKFSKEQMRTVSVINEAFARLAITALSGYLRTVVNIHVFSVDQLTYDEFLRSIPNPTTIAVIDMDPLKGSAVLEIDPLITFSIIDRVFGGQGSSEKYNRDLTDIERAVAEAIVVRMLGGIRESWSQVIDLRPRLIQVETNPQFAQIVPPTEMVLLISLETRINEVEGMLNLCIPYITLEPIASKLSTQHWYSVSRNSDLSESISPLQERLNGVSLDLSAVIGQTDVSVREVLKLRVGDYIRLPQTNVDKEVALQVGGRNKFLCRPGRIGTRLALQVVKQVHKFDENEIESLIAGANSNDE